MAEPTRSSAPNRQHFDVWVRQLLAAEPVMNPTLPQFVAALAGTEPSDDTIERAALGGASADRLGFAFVAGYQAALARLVRASSDGSPARGNAVPRACFAATEAGGAHPRAIQTTLAVTDDGRFVLSGRKAFVTLVAVADEILVVAKRIEAVEKERPTLVVVRVPVNRSGVVSVERPPTSFAPEVPHAEVTFDGVEVSESEILPGDGYASYLKPFRTIEDLHVLCAAAGHLLALARRCENPDLVSRIVTLLAAIRTLAYESPDSAAVHIALASLFDDARALFDVVVSSLGDPRAEERARLERDRPLLLIAETLRAKRTEVARRELGILELAHKSNR